MAGKPKINTDIALIYRAKGFNNQEIADIIGCSRWLISIRASKLRKMDNKEFIELLDKVIKENDTKGMA